MTDECFEQDMTFLRANIQRLNRLVEALEASPLLRAALKEPDPPMQEETDILPLAEMERAAILNAVHRTRDAQRAATLLGIGKTTIYKKLKAFGWKA